LKAEVVELMARAEAADQAEVVADGMSVPEELARREETPTSGPLQTKWVL
jgi:hypothetical protein